MICSRRSESRAVSLIASCASSLVISTSAASLRTNLGPRTVPAIVALAHLREPPLRLGALPEAMSMLRASLTRSCTVWPT